MANHVTGIGCDDAEAYDQDDTAGGEVSRGTLWLLRDGTYGTIPRAARTEGRERMPREIVSAIMTADISEKYDVYKVSSLDCVLIPACLRRCCEPSDRYGAWNVALTTRS